MSSSELRGRDAELVRLEAAWQDPAVHLITLVAWGGVGKTALVARWLADWTRRRGADVDFFEWSFASQGRRDPGLASADTFVDAALRHFGDPVLADSPTGAWEKGARLAELLAQHRALLVLDGLEPLQHPPGPLVGELKDPALRALLRGLARQNAGLAVVTTRERVAELAPYAGPAVQEWRLENLAVPAGIRLLHDLGVHGPEVELAAAVEAVQGHALSLSLLGRYLRAAHGGDVRQRDQVRLGEADRQLDDGHFSALLAAYESSLAAAGEEGQRQLALLRLLALFDRPASEASLAALRQEPAIAGLTETLVGLDDEAWKAVAASLEEARLITRHGSRLDVHPLLREYFASRLQGLDPGAAGPDSPAEPAGDPAQAAAWRESHGRLYDFFDLTTEAQPATLAGLEPLYQAVYHGCQAGWPEVALTDIYDARILRGAGPDGFYSIRKLGAFGADLGAITCFFEEPWSRVTAALGEPDQAWLLNEAATRLRALGRLREALEPMRANLAMRLRREEWEHAPSSAVNLSELELSLGEVAAAVADAEAAVTLAENGGEAFWRMVSRATLADARHQAGDQQAARELFREAEQRQAENQPENPLLYSLRGFQYCDLLLAPAERAAQSGSVDPARAAECVEVEKRATRTLAIAEHHQWLLDRALDHLSRGRSRLYRALLAGEGADQLAPAAGDIEKAVAGLRAAGTQHNLPWALLTRAWLRFAQNDQAGARADLDEAAELAERGSMRLHLADIALNRARFFSDRAALAEARQLIEECGYGRRQAELEELEAKLPPR